MQPFDFHKALDRFVRHAPPLPRCARCAPRLFLLFSSPPLCEAPAESLNTADYALPNDALHSHNIHWLLGLLCREVKRHLLAAQERVLESMAWQADSISLYGTLLMACGQGRAVLPPSGPASVTATEPAGLAMAGGAELAAGELAPEAGEPQLPAAAAVDAEADAAADEMPAKRSRVDAAEQRRAADGGEQAQSQLPLALGAAVPAGGDPVAHAVVSGPSMLMPALPSPLNGHRILPQRWSSNASSMKIATVSTALCADVGVRGENADPGGGAAGGGAGRAGPRWRRHAAPAVPGALQPRLALRLVPWSLPWRVAMPHFVLGPPWIYTVHSVVLFKGLPCVAQQAYTLVREVLQRKTWLMYGRHLDQLLLCAVYAVWKARSLFILCFGTKTGS